MTPASNTPSALRREVVVREMDETEMRVPDRGGAKAFSKQLIRAGKGFTAEPNDDGSWSFFVYEENHPNRWENGA